ncbi:glycosyltransferase [Candidatus Woesearchaeota archaeon]|nr:glycosyltransferase [Candidatus Woesearchaeota archaeon]
MKKIKILALTLSAPTKFHTRSGIFILNQLEYLKNKCDIRILCPYPFAPKTKFLNRYSKYSSVPIIDSIGGMKVYRPKYFMFPRNKITLKFINLLLLIESYFIFRKSKKIVDEIAKKWDFDIVHTHEIISGFLIANYCKKKYNKPVVITLHGEDITKYSKMKLLHALSKFSLKICDRIIAVSNSMKKEIYETCLSNKSIEVIPSGYHVSRFKVRDTKKCRKVLNVPINKKVILFVGGLEERKGVFYLIQALSLLNKNKKMQPFMCYVIGAGSLQKKLEELAIKLKISDKIIFKGQRDPDEVAIWMSASDILVLPSLNEGLPNVISETFASGKPVVATNVAGNPEIVNEKVGYLVAPKDSNSLAEKIYEALNRKWNKKDLLKRASQFSVTNSVKKILRIYKEMAAKDKSKI